MTKKKILGYLFLIVVFGIFVLFFVKGINKSEKFKKKLYDEYPLITKGDQINNLVLSKYMAPKELLRNSPVVAFVSFTNGVKCRIYAQLNSDDLGINEILEVGDILIKRNDNDSIILKKKNETHVFVLFSPASSDVRCCWR